MKKIFVAGSLILLLAAASVYAIDSGSGFGPMHYGQIGYGHMGGSMNYVAMNNESIDQWQTYNCPMFGWTAQSNLDNLQHTSTYRN